MAVFADWIAKNCKFAKKQELELTASVVVFRPLKNGGMEFLAGIRKNDPCAGEWALPGGRVDKRESLAKAAARELEEETGIKCSPNDLIYVTTTKRHKGKKNERFDCVFALVEKPDAKAVGSSDLLDVQWFETGDMPEMAFEHDLRVNDALKVVQDEARGKLIVFEGIDGAGKSTSLNQVQSWLESNGIPYVLTKWNSFDPISKTIKTLKNSKQLTPKLFSTLHAADMIARYENDILPALNSNMTVLCDRYVYTSYVRDQIRGVDQDMLQELYADMRTPTLLVHCIVPAAEAVKRIIKEKGLGYYSSGMDVYKGESKKNSCMKYEEAMDKAYKAMLPSNKGYVKVDTSESMETTRKQLMSILEDIFEKDREK